MKKWTLCLGLYVVTFGVHHTGLLRAAQVAGNDCGIHDTTPPPALKGTGGDGKDYDFEHIADVNEVHDGKVRKYRYEHAIHNRQRRLVLWAEWPEPGIAFQQIDPDGCSFENPRESTIEWKEDPDSLILYGESKQFPHRASAYITKVSSKEFRTTAELPPSLRSRLYSKVRWKEKDMIISLQFETRVSSGPTFFYSVINEGSTEVMFKLDSVISRWAPYEDLDREIEKSGWQRVEGYKDLFRLATGRMTELTMRAPGISSFYEEASQVAVFARAGQGPGVVGIASVYLPPSRVEK